MLPETHRRALLAAARIAGVASAIACSPKVATPPASELDACRDTVRAAFAANPDDRSEPVKTCCQALADAHDAQMARGASQSDWAERKDCCEALDWTGSMACTPWGPPTPPTMLA